MPNTKDVSVRLVINNKTAGELKDFLSKIPDHAKVSVYTAPGDRPWESSRTEITVEWTEEF